MFFSFKIYNSKFQIIVTDDCFQKAIPCFILLLYYNTSSCGGFYGHKQINYYAVFLLPPEMLVLYKQNINFISEHPVDPDKRRYALAEEGPRHYIDIDHYGNNAFTLLPHNWDSAVAKLSADTLKAHGIVPWWVQTMMRRLTAAFKEKNQSKILKLSAEIGHYIADAHVPLHTSSNHNGQLTDQVESWFLGKSFARTTGEKEWDFFIGKADYIPNPGSFIWKRAAESAAAADTVLKFEKRLSKQFGSDQRYAFEERNGLLVRQYSSASARAYNTALLGMVERRMRQSIYAAASFWYTTGVNAGQPDLINLTGQIFFQKKTLLLSKTLIYSGKKRATQALGTQRGTEFYLSY